jgi:hypothetical protein
VDKSETDKSPRAQNQLILSPTSRSSERGYANPIFCVVIVVDLCWNGTQIAESHGGLSFGLSEQRVEVAGLCSSIPCFLKRELFVKVGYSDNSSLYPTLRQRRTPQTSGLRDRWQCGTRTWRDCKLSLFPSDFMPKSSIQPCTTVFTSHFCHHAKRRSANPNILIGTRIALDRVDEVLKWIDRSSMWEGPVRRIKWVMDTLSPIAEVRVVPF